MRFSAQLSLANGNRKEKPSRPVASNDHEPIKTLEFPFRKKGWQHELLKREGLLCLVRRSKKGVPAHFEVVKLRQQRARSFMRNAQRIELAAMELYPSDKDWGTYGFTYRLEELPKAEARFRALG